MIQFITITRNAGGTWTFTWSSTGANFYRVILWGVELARVSETTYTYGMQTTSPFPPPLEVVSEQEEALTELYQPYLLMQWYGEPNVQQYLIQKQVGATWQTVKTLQEVGSWLYSYQTPPLPDDTTHTYRVIAEDKVGNQSVPKIFSRHVVCPLAPPDGKVKAIYEAGNLTILRA